MLASLDVKATFTLACADDIRGLVVSPFLIVVESSADLVVLFGPFLPLRDTKDEKTKQDEDGDLAAADDDDGERSASHLGFDNVVVRGLIRMQFA